MKRKTKKILSYFMVCSLIASSGIFALSYFSNFWKSKDNDHISETISDDVYLDESINKIKNPSNFFSIDSNEYYNFFKLNSSKNNFENYLNKTKKEMILEFEKYGVYLDQNNFYNDILNFFKKIHFDSNNKLSIKINNSFISLDKKNYKISFKFDLTFNNFTNENITYKIADKIFYLKSKESHNLKLIVNNQKFNFELTKRYDGYYLGWNTNAIININNELYNFDNLCFTINNISHAFPFSINGISSSISYYDIFNNSQLIENIDNEFIYDQFDENINKYIEIFIDTIEDIKEITKILATNPTIDNFLSLTSENILNIVFKYTDISPNYKESLIKLMQSREPLINVVFDNRETIAGIVSEIINDNSINADVIESLLESINPNLSNEQLKNELEKLKSLLKDFMLALGVNIDFNYINEIIDIVFDGESNIFDLLNFILITKKEQTIGIINNFLPIKNIDIIIELFSLFTANNGQNKILDLITSYEFKEKFSIIIDAFILDVTLNSIIKSIFDKNNNNFNSNNLQQFLNEIVLKIMEYFSNPNNYSILNDFKNFSISKDKKITLDYIQRIQFKSKISLPLKPLINMISDVVVINNIYIPKPLIEKFLSSNGKMLSIQIEPGDQIIFNFSSNNEPIYPSVVNNFFKNNLAYSFAYDLKITNDMPGMYNSLSSFFETGILNLTENISFELIVQIMENFLIRDYHSFGRMNIVDYDKEIANYDKNLYIFDSYFEWKKISNDDLKPIVDNIRVVDSNSYVVTKRVNNIFEKYDENITLIGKKPIFENYDFIYKIVKNFFSYSSLVEPKIIVQPIFWNSLDLNLLGGSLTKLDIKEIKIIISFPYNVLDITDNKNVEFRQTFEKIFNF